jgi:hypothetical protein
MAQGRNLTVYLTSDVSRFRKGLKQAETGLEKFNRFAKGALVGAAAAAGAFATKFAVDGVQAFLDDDAAARKLAKTLKNLGRAQDTAKVEAYIDAMSKATGVADDQLRPAMEKLLLATKDTATAQALLTTAMDTATGAGVPLETVTSAIAKAINGQYGSIKRLIPTFDTAAAKTGGLANVQQQLNRAYGGQAAERAGTYAGQIDAISTAYAELQEAFGRGLVGNLEDSNSAMGGLDEALYDLQPTVEDIGRSLANVANSLVAIQSALKPVVDLMNTPILDGTVGDILGAPFDVFGDNGALSRLGSIVETVTGNTPPAPITVVPGNGGNFGNTPPPGSYFGTADLYRYATKSDDLTTRADGRSAQTGARTRARP